MDVPGNEGVEGVRGVRPQTPASAAVSFVASVRQQATYRRDPSALSSQVGPTMDEPGVPPILAGALTPEVRARVESFYFSVASVFEAWVKRRRSEHTRRAYRGDVMAFTQFMAWPWPERASAMLTASILDVQAWKESQSAPIRPLSFRSRSAHRKSCCSHNGLVTSHVSAKPVIRGGQRNGSTSMRSLDWWSIWAKRSARPSAETERPASGQPSSVTTGEDLPVEKFRK